MEVSHNARTPKQLEILKAVERKLQRDAELRFDGARVAIRLNPEGEEHAFGNYQAFMKALPELAKQNGKGKKLEAVQTVEVSDEQVALAQADAKLEDALQSLLGDVQAEYSGLVTHNQARWAKGQALTVAEELATELGRLGRRELSSPRKVLSYVVQKASMTLLADGWPEKKVESFLSAYEVSACRRSWQVFARHHGGMDAHFTLSDAVDPTENGTKLVLVREVSVSKAYAMVPIATEENRDRLLSFGYQFGEKELKRFTKYMSDRFGASAGDHVDEILDRVYAARDAGEDPFGWMAEEKKPEVKSIAVDAAFFDGVWMDVKQAATDIWVAQGNGDALDKDGLIPNTVLLERILQQVRPDMYPGVLEKILAE